MDSTLQRLRADCAAISRLLFQLIYAPESQLDWTVSDYRGNCALQLTCHIIRRTPSLQSIDIALKLSQLLHDVLYGRAATINRLINY